MVNLVNETKAIGSFADSFTDFSFFYKFNFDD